MNGKTLLEWLRYGTERLRGAGVPDAETDAFWLLSEVTGLTRSGMFLHGNEIPDAETAERYEALTAKRAERVPLQHIIGKAYFMGLEFRSDGRTLVPRPDTETLAEAVLETCGKSGSSLLDLCTGSGCIAVSLAKLGSFYTVTASDISEDALAAAGENAQINGCPGIRFVKSDLFSALSGCTFDVITVNPPYIREAVIETLMPEVRDHDPYIALSGGADGLVFYRRLAAETAEHLNPGGRIFLEIGYDQAEAVKTLFADAGLEEIKIIHDPGGNPRVVICRK